MTYKDILTSLGKGRKVIIEKILTNEKNRKQSTDMKNQQSE